MSFPNNLSPETAYHHFTTQFLHTDAGKPLPPTPENHAPTWLNNAILRQQNNNKNNNASFLNLQTNTSGDSMTAGGISSEMPSNNESNLNQGGGDSSGNGVDVSESDEGLKSWTNVKFKAEILAHPLYDRLLSAHVACLRIATPVDQLARIDAQLAQSRHVVGKYMQAAIVVGEEKELDQFMVASEHGTKLEHGVLLCLNHYVLFLCSFKEQLRQHVRVHAMEAVMACWELEQSLQSLTGVSLAEGTDATMSDDEEDLDSDTNLYDASFYGSDNTGFDPLILTDTERSLMERVRQELKHDLKQGYKEKLVDIREEILRKRRAGKLPGDTTSHLKAWWQSHSKWPYPTEEDKAKLVEETGLQLKQINNWFINQRKRNWHSNPSSSSVIKSKRKR